MPNSIFDILDNPNIRSKLDRKIIIWGTGVPSINIFSALKALEVEVAYFVDKNKEKQSGKFLNYDVKDPSEILNESTDEIFVFLAVPTRYQDLNLIRSLSLVENKNYVSIQIFSSERGFDLFDVMLSHSRSDTIEGFRVYGEQNTDDFKIIVLGNSCSDPYMNPENSWPYLLYNKLSKNGVRCTLYNGAVGGYTSSQEMLKLIRDCISLSPNLILSFNGINERNFINLDSKHPLYAKLLKENVNTIFEENEVKSINNVSYLNSIGFGTESNITDYENWYKNVRIMFSVAKEFNIRYFCFLQPTYFYGKSDTSHLEQCFYNNIINSLISLKIWEKDLDSLTNFYKNAVEISKENDYIVNFTELFEYQENAYLDNLHYTKRGNKKIADAVYNQVMPYIIHERG